MDVTLRVSETLVFHNPHVDDFLASPPHFALLKRRPLKKYGFLFNGLIQSGLPINVWIDDSVSAFFPDYLGFPRWPRVLRRLVAFIESRAWIRQNGLEGKVHFVEPDSNKILLSFSYKSARHLSSQDLSQLARFRETIFHLSHYFLNTSTKSANLSRIANVHLAGDSDVSQNEYFRHHFGWYRKPFMLVPFAVGSRFQSRIPFLERQSRCVAVGTIHDLSQEKFVEDYTKFFQVLTYHPVRKLLKDHAEVMSDVIDCKVSYYRGQTSGGWLKQHFSVSQKSYFNIDLVDLYNSYRYAIVGEEAVGFPALGAFEAMACGTLLLAQAKYYQGLGLEDGVHFVGHDGTLESIRTCIEELNQTPKRAAAIAERGCRYVIENFSSESAFLQFAKQIDEMT